MNQTTLAVALIAVAASAAPGGGHRNHAPQGKVGQDPEFQNYAAKFNKNFRSTGDFEARHENYIKLDKVVRETNKKADQSNKKEPLRLKHNQFSDMSHDEYMQLLGLNAEQAEEDLVKKGRGNGNGNGNGNGHAHGRGLQMARSTAVDWAADGYVSPVKDQGQCGSCWSFAATTALESARAVASNEAPIHLSEQQLVDCTLDSRQSNIDRFGNYGMGGCNGGIMGPAWNFFRDHGAMSNADYPYVSGSTKTEMTCMHNDDPSTHEGRPSSYNFIAENTEAMKAAVEIRPLSIGVDASSYAFQAYSSGVIEVDSGCGEGLNHAIVIVGYTDGGSVDPPSPGPTPPPPAPVEDSCQVTRWWHKCTSAPARRLQDADGDDRYWKVQNSWGVGWGNEGFAKIGFSDSGRGICGINYYVQNVEWQF